VKHTLGIGVVIGAILMVEDFSPPPLSQGLLGVIPFSMPIIFYRIVVAQSAIGLR